VTVTCSTSGDELVSIRWFLGGHDVTDRSTGSTYLKGLITSKMRVNFTSVLEAQSTYKCKSVDRLQIKCSSTVDCVSVRENANGDRKSFTFHVFLGKCENVRVSMICRLIFRQIDNKGFISTATPYKLASANLFIRIQISRPVETKTFY